MKKSLLFWSDDVQVNRLSASLVSGLVSIGSSDTVLGLMAPLTLSGYQALNSIKQRNDKPYVILLPSLDYVTQFAQISNTINMHNLLQSCWPGPVTIVMKVAVSVPFFLKSTNGTIAIRIPAHTGLQKLLKQVPGIFSTSANLAGDPVPSSLDQINDEILQKIAYCIIDKEDNLDNKQPSTILDCSQERITVLRQGAYSIDLLEKAYGLPFLK